MRSTTQLFNNSVHTVSFVDTEHEGLRCDAGQLRRLEAVSRDAGRVLLRRAHAGDGGAGVHGGEGAQDPRRDRADDREARARGGLAGVLCFPSFGTALTTPESPGGNPNPI